MKLWKEFERIGHDYAVEKNRAEAEYKALEGEGNAAKVESLQFRLDNAYKQSVLKTQELIKANADNYVSAYIIALNMVQMMKPRFVLNMNYWGRRLVPQLPAKP